MCWWSGVADRHRNRKRFEGQRFMLHCDIALRVGGRAPDDPNRDREGLVEEVFLPSNWEQLDEILRGPRVDFATTKPRVDEGTKAHAGQMTGPMGGDISKQMRDDAFGQVIGLDLVGDSQLLHLRNEPPMAANDALEKALVSEVVEASLFSVSLAPSVDEG